MEIRTRYLFIFILGAISSTFVQNFTSTLRAHEDQQPNQLISNYQFGLVAEPCSNQHDNSKQALGLVFPEYDASPLGFPKYGTPALVFPEYDASLESKQLFGMGEVSSQSQAGKSCKCRLVEITVDTTTGSANADPFAKTESPAYECVAE